MKYLGLVFVMAIVGVLLMYTFVGSVNINLFGVPLNLNGGVRPNMDTEQSGKIITELQSEAFPD